MRDMTVTQARTFEEIIAPLRGRGFDEQGLGVRSSHLHIDRRGANGGIRVRLGFLDVCRRHGRTAETVFQASGTVIEFPGFLKAMADDDRLQH